MTREQTKAELARIDELERKVRELLKDLPGMRAQQQMRIGFGASDMVFSPVMLLVERNGSIDKSPRRRDFQPGPEGSLEYKAKYKAWADAALAQAEVDIKAAEKILRKAKISFRSGRDYQWPILRLA